MGPTQHHRLFIHHSRLSRFFTHSLVHRCTLTPTATPSAALPRPTSPRLHPLSPVSPPPLPTAASVVQPSDGAKSGVDFRDVFARARSRALRSHVWRRDVARPMAPPPVRHTQLDAGAGLCVQLWRLPMRAGRLSSQCFCSHSLSAFSSPLFRLFTLSAVFVTCS